MKKQEAIAILNHQEKLKDFHIKSLVLFGSVARDEARPDQTAILKYYLRESVLNDAILAI